MGKFEAGSGPSNDISSSTDFKINVSVDQKTSERLRNVGTISCVFWGMFLGRSMSINENSELEVFIICIYKYLFM